MVIKHKGCQGKTILHFHGLNHLPDFFLGKPAYLGNLIGIKQPNIVSYLAAHYVKY